MKRLSLFYLGLCMCVLGACGQTSKESEQTVVDIELSDEVILVDGQSAKNDAENAVYIANDIVYYETGKDFTYGEGSDKDAHSAEEAIAHTVVHITEPGSYRISGKLSQGQIAVDLGEEAKESPEAVVTLIMNGVDITCKVAPAVIFYNVYECGNTDVDSATKDVDTSSAGANVFIEDGTTNTINASYVEKIYKPESVTLNADKTEVEDAKKLHKYDGAFYSRMSMNINGGEEGSGILNINAQNEGLDSELHLTINGGNVNINSGNDGINTNEDGISVTTVNGGNLSIKVTGETGEGDGIDSNGWLVINGGNVMASACSDSADAGIDSDMGIHIQGGNVIASGHMLDRIEENGQTYAVFNFSEKQDGTDTLYLKDAEGEIVMKAATENTYSIIVFSSPELVSGKYTLWSGEKQLSGQSGGMMGRPEMQELSEMPGMTEMRPEDFEGQEPPQGERPFDRKEFPEGEGAFEGKEPPEGEGTFAGQEPPERPNEFDGELLTEFQISDGANMFGKISE